MPAHTRRTIAHAIANVRTIAGEARSTEAGHSATAAIQRLRAIERHYGDLFDAIETGDEDTACSILAQMLHAQRKQEAIAS